MRDLPSIRNSLLDDLSKATPTACCAANTASPRCRASSGCRSTCMIQPRSPGKGGRSSTAGDASVATVIVERAPDALRWWPFRPESILGIVVYWLDEGDGAAVRPGCEAFGSDELVKALAWAETQRKQGRRHVCISTELEDHVGRAGVAAVEAGRTPDGQAYEWSKAGRAGKPRRR